MDPCLYPCWGMTVATRPETARRRKRLPIVTVTASLAGAALLGLLVYGISNQSPSRTLDEALARGQHPAAPDATYRLPSLSGGGQRTLASFHGKVVLLNFWASWCEPCQHEAGLLERAEHELSGHRATVLGVTYEDASTDSRGFVAKYGITYPNLRDASGSLASAFGTRQVPESFIINRSGRIVDINRGEIQGGFVKRALKVAEET